MRSRFAASGWRGVTLIAVVYVYFLIFAQFAFLARLAELGITGRAFKLVMAAMAAGGILLSVATPRLHIAPDPASRLRFGFVLSAAVALLTLAPLAVPFAIVAAFLIGAALGITTVTLVTHLRAWTNEHRGIICVGLGTGIAYFICNVPAVFGARPQVQTILAATLCAAACALPLASSPGAVNRAIEPRFRMPFAIVLPSFAALIWLDSAAFYIIQHTQSLKADTWLGSAHLWANGSIHFAAAIVAAVLLERARPSATLALAFGALGFACLLLQNSALILSASLFYPIGVSLYSVALVAYPSFLTTADSIAERGIQAGYLYAVAGWVGSALGIGMGQNLGHVPVPFVAAAGIVVLAPASISLAKNRPRELALLAAMLIAAFLVYRALPNPGVAQPLPAAERGRQVYISEGCISCHSQYVRADSPDVLMWGPAETLASVHRQKPPLIGNRRQGPDLSEVGLRRSPLWLKAHLINPAEVSYHSPMPAFAVLFHDGRGDDLVAYLASLRGPGEEQQLALQASWQPSAAAWTAANPTAGERVYQQYCATCHDPRGAARLHWTWRKAPADPDLLHVLAQDQAPAQLARIAKFGIPDSDMPGHEYLSDAQIASVAVWLKLSNRNVPLTSTN